MSPKTKTNPFSVLAMEAIRLLKLMVCAPILGDKLPVVAKVQYGPYRKCRSVDGRNEVKIKMARPQIVMLTTALVVAQAMATHSQSGAADGHWPHYAGDKGSTKYAPLNQINRSNVNDLEEAWRWASVDALLERPGARSFKTTPIVVDGVMYTSTAFSQVAAIDPGTGETLWVYDPKDYERGRAAHGRKHRGVDYWTDGEKKRIVIATSSLQLVSIDTETGKPDPEFGDNGVVDLAQSYDRPVDRRHLGHSAPPVVCRNTIILGSVVTDSASTKTKPPGDIRGFDIYTGEQKWIFHTIPQEGEFGVETWLNDSWKYTGSTNAWSMLSADEELGYVYVPVGTPTGDFYGELRHGDNLFAETLLCLNAETGERVWHFQTTHHGLWDYDLPAAPNLVDIVVDGKAIKAVAQISKQGFVYIFDRVTGDRVWPIEERPVRQSTAPGEKSSLTQPFPAKPPAFEQQGLTVDDLIHYTPELRKEAEQILSNFTAGPLYGPPTVVTDTNRGTVMIPGTDGGANWQGACVDPDTGIMYVPSMTRAMSLGLRESTDGRTEFSYVLAYSFIEGPQGLPITKPPYSRITAIDLNQGEIVWQVPHGDGPRDHPAIKHLNLGPLGKRATGITTDGGGVLTKELLFAIQSDYHPESVGRSTDGVIRAFDKTNGEELWEFRLGKAPRGTPMTYMHDGQQYVVVGVGGGVQPAEYVALRLKKK